MPTTALCYFHLYTDDRGETHFREEKLVLEGDSFMGGPPVLTHALALAAGKNPQLAHIPAGASYDWHNSAQRQFLFVVQGSVDFTASDGAVHQARPGALVLFDDVSGKGHRTRASGPNDHIALAIPLP